MALAGVPFPVIAYWPYWTKVRYSYDYDWLPFSFITTICHYGIRPDDASAGDIVEPTAGGEITWPETALITHVHNAGKLITLLVGGAEAGADAGFRAVCGHHGSGALRQDLVDNTMALVDGRGYDGVDLDWEYPGYSGIEKVVSGATNATPIRITTSTNHGYVTGKKVFVRNVTGNTAANGEWTITIDATSPLTTFTLNTSVGNGAFVAGGDVSEGPEDRDGYADLIDRFRTALGDDRILSHGGAASDNNGHWVPILTPVIGGNTPIDNVNWWLTQTYGLHGTGWAGHSGHVGALHSAADDDPFHYPYEPPYNTFNYSWDQSFAYWHTERGVPLQKLLMGIGTYGNRFPTETIHRTQQVATITDATNANPIVVTSARHTFVDGDVVDIAAVTGNTAANGQHTVANATLNTFELAGVAGNGAYAGGGTATPQGAHTQSIATILSLGANTWEIVLNLGSPYVKTTDDPLGNKAFITGTVGFGATLNGKTFAIASVVNTNSFTIVDATIAGAYVSGGTATIKADGGGGWDGWMDYAEGLTLIGNGTWTEHHDDDADASYYTNDNGASTVSLPTPVSVVESVEYAYELRALGIGIWSIGKDLVADDYQALMGPAAHAAYMLASAPPLPQVWVDLRNSGIPDELPANEVTDYLGSVEYEGGWPEEEEGSISGSCTIELLNESGDFSPELSTTPWRVQRAAWENSMGLVMVPFTSTGAGNERRLANLFTPDGDDIIDAAFAYLATLGTPAGTVRAEIWTDVASLPGALVSSEHVSLEYDIATIGASVERFGFRFPRPPAVTGGVTYALVLITTGYTRTAGVTELQWQTASTHDTFTRADSVSTLGTAPSGQDWVPSAGTWGIATNKAYNASAGNDDRALINTGTVDGAWRASLQVDSYVTNAAELVFRAPNLQFFPDTLKVRLGDTGTVSLQKVSGGTPVTLDSVAHALVGGTPYVVTVTAYGKAIKVYVDGSLVLSYTMTDDEQALFAGEGHSYAGFRVGGAGGNARFDAFTGNYGPGFAHWNGAAWSAYTLGDGTQTDAKFSVESNGMQVGRRVYIGTYYAGEDNPNWSGFITDVDLDPDGRVAFITLADRLDKAIDIPTDTLPLATDITIHDSLVEVVEDYLYEGLALAGNYSIGVESQTIAFRFAEPGTSTRDLLDRHEEASAGKQWMKAALPPYYDKYVFRSKDDEQSPPASSEDWAAEVGKDVTYRSTRNQALWNPVKVWINGRKEGAANSVLWSYGVDVGAGEPFLAGEVKDIDAEFSNPALVVDAMTPGTDPATDDYTGTFAVALTAYGHTAALSVTDGGTADDLELLQIRGTPLDPKFHYSVTREDAVLRKAAGGKKKEINNSLVQTRDHAVWLGEEVLRQGRRRYPEYRVSRQDEYLSMLRRGVGDVITLWLSDVAPEATYYIQWFKVSIGVGSRTSWRATYRLRRPTAGG